MFDSNHSFAHSPPIPPSSLPRRTRGFWLRASVWGMGVLGTLVMAFFPEAGPLPAEVCRAESISPVFQPQPMPQDPQSADDAAACSPPSEPEPGEPAAEGGTGTRGDGRDDGPPFKFEKHGAIVYAKGDDYRLTLDVYQPEGAGPFPVVLAIHGGGWRGGSKITMTRHAWLLARSGYVVVAINYRFAPEYPFPAQVIDCKQAVRWIRRHAEKYNIDPKRLIAFGYSAGGHLAAMLGATDPDDGLEGDVDDPRLKKISTRVQAAICGGAVCDFEWVDPDSPILAFWLSGTPRQRPETYRLAAPISHVTADDPPFFIYHGGDDMVVPIGTARRMHTALDKAGVPNRFVEVPGKGHVRTFVDLSLLPQAIEFLRQEGKLEPPTANTLIAARVRTRSVPFTL